jgi:hypothetical protein
MNPSRPHPDEELSAYHDGELSPTERAAVERRLAESVDDRTTLEAYGDLSRELASLSPVKAPQELRAAVLRRIQSLSTQPQSAATRRGRGARRSWMLWGASLAAVAGLLLAVALSGRFGRDDAQLADASVVTGQAAPSAAANSAETAFDKPNADAAAGDSSWWTGLAPRGGEESADESTAANIEFPMVEPAAEASPAPGGLGGGGDSPPRSAPFRAEPARSASSVDPLPLSPERLVLDPLAPPAVADVLAYMDRLGDQAVIVEVEVVDVDQTADDMLVLLRKRGVHVLAADGSRDNSGSATADTQPTTADGDMPPLVAVFVEASDAQLAGLVEDLASQVSIANAVTRNTAVLDSPLNRSLVSFETAWKRMEGVEQLESASGERERTRIATDEPAVTIQSIPPAPAPAPVATAESGDGDADREQSSVVESAQGDAGAARRIPGRVSGIDREAAEPELGWSVRFAMPQQEYGSRVQPNIARDSRVDDAVETPAEPLDVVTAESAGDAAVPDDAEGSQRRQILFVIQPAR